MSPPSSGQRIERQQLQQIIAGLTEGVILIDPDQTIAWANTAALSMHGARELADLGRTVDEYRERFQLRYRNHHALDDGTYPADRVVAGELFTDVMVEVARHGETEPEWVHRVRSLVLNDANGDPDCLVLIITDATDEMQAVERFERAFNANPAPALICRISDLRFIRVNQGFLDMTGYTRQAIIGRSVYDLDVMSGADRRELGKARLSEWATVPQMEASLPLPEGETKLVIVAGQPIEIGDERCMLFTFADLEPRRKAESALRNSEEKFAKTFRLAPVPMKVSTLDGFRIVDVNEAFLKETGWAIEEVVGRSAAEIELWDTATTRRRMESELVETGGFRGYEAKLKKKDGSTADCLVSAETIRIGGETCVLDVFQDITARKTSELELVRAIEEALADTSWLSRSVMEKLADMRSPQREGARKPSSADLTEKERQVLGLISQGLDDGEIAKLLFLSRNTVRNHVQRIYAKTGVHRRGEAIVWARERGIVGSQPPAKRPKKT
ncbi:helix-turn-helix transcriptional regulator [Aureimonas phyllosphaerae]|uniref:PAS domain S-box-containing protein n=1 Tax=Aureimonas phyllosphaerae TaxID=1166078 RepID=A0A7W6BV02_9HYPH|nr:PAS domain S-box protein [Aureimonas phyllosphaerae]MBB3934226.1 PAS domain S-box-containing protein [Aureimonas phyllosphaerae]MBB3958558.1 PAS domain S-box-containing protein [Aureimonas phyllosphaerae]SFE98812.1 transcriptional regulator, LuxR family [Aureimonas phyllosphaerae]